MATPGRQDIDENAWIQLYNGTASCEAGYSGLSLAVEVEPTQAEKEDLC